MGIIYSSTPATPKRKPPRFDLRNRPKKNIDQSPKSPKVEIPDGAKLQSLDEVDGLFNFLSNRIDDPYGLQPETTPVQPFGVKKKPKTVTPTPTSKSGTVKLSFSSNDWVFTQVTAVSSVNTHKDKPWQITGDTIQYVNANGNSWETSFLKSCYKTFIGAKNLKDHIDTDEGGIIYGILIDAVPRRIKVGASGYVLYIDVVIATNRHIDPEWADAIEKGKIKFLSVGFKCDYLQCSKCGHIYKIDKTGICQHTSFEMGLVYYDQTGRKSKVSEMATDADGLGKAEFYELSYLSVDPAFTGAAQGHVLEVPKGQSVTVSMPVSALKRPAYRALKKWIKTQS